MRKIQILCNFVIILVINCDGQNLLNKQCQVARTGASGTCQFMRQCRPVLVDFEEKGILPSNCGYENGQAVICCPSPTTIAPRIDVPITRISQESKETIDRLRWSDKRLN